MELSIIILNYNAAAFLELCIDSVFRATKNINAEIIVADNNSTDSSLQMLHFVFKDKVKVLAFEDNHGFSKGNNLAVKEASGEYLCILNPDTIVGEHVFEECLSFARSSDSAFAKAKKQLAFLGTQLIDGSGIFLPESKRHVPTPKVARQKLLGNDESYYHHELAKDENGAVEVLVGAFMFCKKSVYETIGGFDERYFMYGEDIDLSYSALLYGYENYYLGSQKVIHFKGESTIKDKKYLDRFYGAMQLFYDKHFKQSAMQRALVKIGVAFLKTRPIKKEQTVTKVNHQVLISNDEPYQWNGVEKYSFTELQSLKLQDHTQIIWDIKSLNMTSIIDFMSTNTGSNITYRFMSERRDFMLGSNYSNNRGEVVYLNK